MNNYREQWEAKQARMKELCDKEVEGRTEEIERLGAEVHELMRLDWEENN